MKPKRIISLLVAVCMLVAMLPVSALPAFAAGPTTVDGIKYNFDSTNKTAAVAGIDASAGTSIAIPASVTYNGADYSVTSVANNAFKDNTTLQSIKLPDTVTEIGQCAFQKCTAVVEVDFSKLQKIHYSAFEECTHLKGNNIDLSGLTVLEYSAFRGCSDLTGDLTLSSSITSISNYTFANCTGLNGTLTVQQPISITTIGPCAFQNCSNLKGTLPWLANVTSIAGNAFQNCKSLTGNIDLSSVTSLGQSAFQNCSGLTGSLTIPGTVKTIDIYTFSGCSGFNGKLTISDGVESIAAVAFSDCSGLTGDLVIPNSVKEIKTSAFKNCSSLNSLTVSGNVSIGTDAFNNCSSLSKIEFSGSVSTIGSTAFKGCTGLNGDFTLPNGLTTLGQLAFDNSGIDRIIIPNTLHDATINIQTKELYYNGTRAELEEFLTDKNITVTNLNKNTMKIGSQYLYYNCDVTFDTDGGTPTSEPQNNIYRTNLLDSSKVNTPSKKGYVFDGWYYTDSTGKETKFDPAKDKVTDSMTLKAKWTVPAAVTVSGLPTGELAQGKQYPFTIAVDPKEDTGNGRLNVALAGSGDRLYRRLSSGELEPMTGYSLNIALAENEYEYVLIPGQTGPDSLNVTLKKNGITDPRDTVTIDFTVREYQNAEVSLEGLDNVTFKQGEPQEFSVRVTPNDDSGKACLDFGKDNADIEYQENGEWKQMPEDGLTIDLDEGEQVYALRYTPQLGGKNQSLRVTVKPVDSDFGKNETTIDIAEKAKKSLTLTGGTVKVNGEEVALDADKECVIEEGSTVEVTFDKSILSDAQVFDQWSIKPDSVLNAVDSKAETITFKMPAEKVAIEAMTRDASIQEEPNVLGAAAVIGIGVAGTAVLGYQGYMIGTELYLKNVMPAGAAIPQNYGELALLVWTDAGKPVPAAVLAADATDEQKALTWAVENQLISADKAADASVTRWEVIQTWNQEQEMKKA